MEDITKAKEFTVRLYSGKYVQINDLKLSDICIEDITHSLAFKPRFNGNGKSWYSIAAHSIAVSHLVPPRYKLSALLHDSSESYLFDIPSPNKKLKEFKDIVSLEDKIQNLVYEKFFIKEEDRMCELIRIADCMELQREWNLCMLSDKLSSNPKEDEREFIRLFILYSNYMIKGNFIDNKGETKSYLEHNRNTEQKLMITHYNKEKIVHEVWDIKLKHNIQDSEVYQRTD